MSEQSIPAWKRVGLKQVKNTPKKSEAAYDPLKEGLKRALTGDDSKPSKPAKRAKVPKSERPPPTHELDQYAYLRQYSEDRANWKFSKQKQNWILKNLFTKIEDRYEDLLISYIEGLMGSARNRVAEEAKGIVTQWNEFMNEDLENKDDNGSESQGTESSTPGKSEDGAEPLNKRDDNTKTANTSQSVPESKEENSKSEKGSNKAVPSEKMAMRAYKIYKVLTGEDLHIEYINTTSP